MLTTILNLLIFVVCVLSTQADNNTDAKLEELHKKKNELVIKIQNAIEDSVKTLQQNNDGDGLHQLKELQKQFNETLIEDELNEILYSNKSARRNHQPRYLKRGKLKLDLFDIAGLFGNKKIKVHSEQRQRNQEIMREKLREWMLMREQERKKIKQYQKQEKFVREDCPKFGTKTKKAKKKKNRRSFDSKNRRNGQMNEKKSDETKDRRSLDTNADNSTRKTVCKELGSSERGRRSKPREPTADKYPCCRKCCKSSYLGCL
ncbi:uncharacterized protein LOC128681252 [Plodia interpunctella]|uniref:uncharacterized protein LOC128681252 n=1 Tax=Plodia interpunctella TaxID=58824 RepID=UPI002367825F|nr:uncharacterized protein LOC128681252 [Plodia interpunctella]